MDLAASTRANSSLKSEEELLFLDLELEREEPEPLRDFDDDPDERDPDLPDFAEDLSPASYMNISTQVRIIQGNKIEIGRIQTFMITYPTPT